MAKGYTRLVLQVGRGDEPRVPPEVAGIRVHSYHFKPTLKEDMLQSSLIISHGGIFYISLVPSA